MATIYETLEALCIAERNAMVTGDDDIATAAREAFEDHALTRYGVDAWSERARATICLDAPLWRPEAAVAHVMHIMADAEAYKSDTQW